MSMDKFRLMVDSLARNQGARDANPRILICFEDAKSAPRYFKALRIHRSLTKQSVRIDSDSTVSDPHSVVKRAVELRDDLISREDFSEEDGDSAWAVVDVDKHESIPNAIQLANSENIKLAISNPCFEYWILLHYENSAPYVMNCSDLISKHLKNHMPGYDKGSTDYQGIVDHADLAAERAERQFKGKAESDPTKCCPCTMVFRLVRSLPK